MRPLVGFDLSKKSELNSKFRPYVANKGRTSPEPGYLAKKCVTRNQKCFTLPTELHGKNTVTPTEGLEPSSLVLQTYKQLMNLL